MTDASLPNRSSNFSRALLLLQLALWRLGLGTLSFVDDIILLDMPPPSSPERDPRPASLQTRDRVPSSRLVPIDTEPPLGAPSRTEAAATPVCKYPSCGRQTWASYDFCGNTHAMMAGAKPLDSTHAAPGIRQTHTWYHVTKRCSPLAPAPEPTSARPTLPTSQSVASQTSPPPLDDDESWKWGWSPPPSPGRQHYE